MNSFLKYNLQEFIAARKLPLEVVHIPPGRELRKVFHTHLNSEIVIILGGKGVHLFENQHYPIKVGDVLLIHQNVRHAYDPQELELVNILYDLRQQLLPTMDGSAMPLFRKFFPDEASGFAGQVEPILSLSESELEIIRQKVQNIDDELKSGRPGCNILSFSLFIDLIVSLCRMDSQNEAQQKTPLSQIGAAVEYMNINYQRQITIEQLAKKACMSRRSFFINFKDSAGCTPLQYLTRIRISRAIELLLYSEMTIGDIAVRCGFSDSNYFCRIFRTQTGSSPQQYRLNHRG